MTVIREPSYSFREMHAFHHHFYFLESGGGGGAMWVDWGGEEK
jgi:hypothetical protein